MNDRSTAHDASIEWIKMVGQWVADMIPGSGYSSDWASLGVSDLVLDNSVGSDRKEWVPFREMVNKRLTWLSKLQQDFLASSGINALTLAYEIENFTFCGPSDDPDEQTAVIYGFKSLAKRFIGVIERIPRIKLPSHIQLDINNIIETYDLHADLMIVVDHLRNYAVGTQETEVENIGIFISQTAIDELKGINSTEHDTRKLIRFCEEINSSYTVGNIIAVTLLLRALLNHVPPIFGYLNFKEVVAQSSRSMKEILKPLEVVARDVADHHSHAPIRHNEPLPSVAQVEPFKPSLEFLIHELASKLKSTC